MRRGFRCAGVALLANLASNHAERGLRGAVIYRKLSLGSQSEQGERTIERLLSASITCRLQGRSLFAYLTDVLNASIRGDPIPAPAVVRKMHGSRTMSALSGQCTDFRTALARQASRFGCLT
jgi:hypothetical protein